MLPKLYVTLNLNKILQLSMPIYCMNLLYSTMRWLAEALIIIATVGKSELFNLY